MHIVGGKEKYIRLLGRQLFAMTSIEYSEDNIVAFLKRHTDVALKRLEKCLSKFDIKHNSCNGEIVYNPLHSGHCSIFLYYLSQEARQEGGTWSQMVAYLNKMLNGLECSPFVELPEYFFWEHPLGTILGRAKYRNGFFCLQGCTVGVANGHKPLVFLSLGRMY